MIILDFSQVMISNLMMQLGNHTNIPIEEGLFRHMVINSLRSYKSKFSEEFGEIIIACDDKNYWRKQVFPYYKANRKKNRDASEIDWTHVFECFNKIKQEIKEYFPYRVVQVDSAEADDIIATLVGEYGTDLNGPTKILILSGDKDFIQLHSYGNVKQFTASEVHPMLDTSATKMQPFFISIKASASSSSFCVAQGNAMSTFASHGLASGKNSTPNSCA